MHTGAVWSALALGLTLASPLLAQQPATLAPGARVRITWLEDRWTLIGNLRAVRGDTVVAYDTATGTETAVPLAWLRLLEVSQGRGTGFTLAVLGAAAGGAAGVLLARTLWRPHEDPCSTPQVGVCIDLSVHLDREATTFLGGLAGAIVLGLVGHSFDAVEHWESVPLDRIRVGLAPLPAGRLGLGAAVSF